MTRRSVVRSLAGLLLPASAVGLAGCDPPPPVALVFVGDRTFTAKGRDTFEQAMEEQLLGTRRLADGVLGLVVLSGTPELLDAGGARDVKSVQKAWARMRESRCVPEEGTDPFTAFEIADRWLADPRSRDYRRIAILRTDLRCERGVDGVGNVRRFRDPAEFRWTSNPECYLYDLPVDRHSGVQEAWSGLKVLRLHQPGERFDLEELKLPPPPL